MVDWVAADYVRACYWERPRGNLTLSLLRPEGWEGGSVLRGGD